MIRERNVLFKSIIRLCVFHAVDKGCLVGRKKFERPHYWNNDEYPTISVQANVINTTTGNQQKYEHESEFRI